MHRFHGDLLLVEGDSTLRWSRMLFFIFVKHRGPKDQLSVPLTRQFATLTGSRRSNHGASA